MTIEMSAAELKDLFLVVCNALTCELADGDGPDDARMKPRDKQLGLLLACESFGKGSESGAVDMKAWRLRLASWRSNELADMWEVWRRAGWVAVDVTENNFRLAPDLFPGWANVQAMLRSQQVGTNPLNLVTEDDLHKTFAKISQFNAKSPQPAEPAVAKISQTGRPDVTKISQIAKISQNSGPELAKISQSGGVGGETFTAVNVKRINVKEGTPRQLGTDCENFAKAPDAEALRERVKGFVGTDDWENEFLWNSGTGWRAKLFHEEARELDRALNYCTAGLKSGEVTIKKTKGAMLWNQFQRERQERANA